jgi:hypothetical protein
MTIGYMCATDWDHELGEASGGTRVFSSTEDLKKYKTCFKECGIVEVEVNFVRLAEAGRGWDEDNG